MQSYSCIIVSLFLYAGSLYGMDLVPSGKENNQNGFESPVKKQKSVYSYNPESPFKKDTVLFSDDNAIQNQIIKRIDETPKGGYIHIQSPFISLWKLEGVLNNAVKRGVTVKIDGTGRSTLLNKLDNRVERNIVRGLHTKRVIISSQHPEKADGTEETHVFIGSDNLSNISSGHKEMMEYTRNDSGWFLSNHEDISSSTNVLPNKQVIKKTPLKKKLTSTTDTDTNESKLVRIASVREVLKNNNTTPFFLDIASMTFDQENIAQEVANVCQKARECGSETQRVRVFLDKSANLEKNKPLLNQMSNAGAEVYIYNQNLDKQASKNYVSLQHQKTIIRYIEGYEPEYLTIISTGNLTTNSGREKNVDSYDVSKDKFDAIKRNNDKLIEVSTRFIGEVDEAKPSAQKRQKLSAQKELFKP